MSARKLGTHKQKALIFDVFRGQTGERVQALLEESNIIVPGSCTDILEPFDLSTDKALKSKMLLRVIQQRSVSKWQAVLSQMLFT